MSAAPGRGVALMKLIGIIAIVLGVALLSGPLGLGLFGGLFGGLVGLVFGAFGLVVGLVFGLIGGVIGLVGGLLGAAFGLTVAFATLALPVLIVVGLVVGLAKLAALV